MRMTATMGGLANGLGAERKRIERGTTGGMRLVTTGLKGDLRDQVKSAGLGQRLANTWQGNTYPKTGTSLSPATYVYSKAPKIIMSFTTGATIRPVNGTRYLWIPTDNVPRSGRRGSKGAISPDEVEQRFGPFFFRPGKRGNVLAFVAGTRRAARGGARKARSRGILMFTLARFIVEPQLLEMNGTAQRWGMRAPALIEQEIGRQA